MDKQEIFKRCVACRIIFVICLLISSGLMIGGFCVPPHGVFDGSVLKACGILFLFAALAVAVRAIELGYDLKVAKGDASVELNNN